MSRSPLSPLRLAALGLLVAGVAVGCGGDDASSRDAATTTAPAAAPTGGDTDGSSNPDVERFCADAEAVAEELADVIADPMSGDLAALQQRVTELTASAAQLTSASADDTARINECSQLMTAALGG